MCYQDDLSDENVKSNMELKTWDPEDHLDSDEAIAAYLEAAFNENDAALFAAAINDIVRARKQPTEPQCKRGGNE